MRAGQHVEGAVVHIQFEYFPGKETHAHDILDRVVLVITPRSQQCEPRRSRLVPSGQFSPARKKGAPATGPGLFWLSPLAAAFSGVLQLDGRDVGSGPVRSGFLRVGRVGKVCQKVRFR